VLHYRLVRRVMADVGSAAWPGSVAEVRPRVVLRLAPGECPPPDATRSLLRRGGLPPEHLEVVVREAESGDPAVTARICREAGTRLVVDGVGGRTSIGVPAALRPHALRLDASVVRHLGTDPGADAVAEAVALVANRLGVTAAADGVESDLQRRVLLQFGYRSATGRLFGGPAPLGSLSI
jgi:EAL domain-containing protein (putative c-di-GMP-specific phosphodiesterase class I)